MGSARDATRTPATSSVRAVAGHRGDDAKDPGAGARVRAVGWGGGGRACVRGETDIELHDLPARGISRIADPHDVHDGRKLAEDAGWLVRLADRRFLGSG